MNPLLDAIWNGEAIYEAAADELDIIADELEALDELDIELPQITDRFIAADLYE